MRDWVGAIVDEHCTNVSGSTSAAICNLRHSYVLLCKPFMVLTSLAGHILIIKPTRQIPRQLRANVHSPAFHSYHL